MPYSVRAMIVNSQNVQNPLNSWTLVRESSAAFREAGRCHQKPTFAVGLRLQDL